MGNHNITFFVFSHGCSTTYMYRNIYMCHAYMCKSCACSLDGSIRKPGIEFTDKRLKSLPQFLEMLHYKKTKSIWPEVLQWLKIVTLHVEILFLNDDFDR